MTDLPFMTDLTPNDLSHLSDAEFNALCPQGEHAPGPEPLTPAAQKVLDAAVSAYAPGVIYEHRISIAAVLRAAADHTEADSIWHGHQEHTGVRWAAHQLHTIAAELEGADG